MKYYKIIKNEIYNGTAGFSFILGRIFPENHIIDLPYGKKGYSIKTLAKEFPDNFKEVTLMDVLDDLNETANKILYELKENKMKKDLFEIEIEENPEQMVKMHIENNDWSLIQTIYSYCYQMYELNVNQQMIPFWSKEVFDILKRELSKIGKISLENNWIGNELFKCYYFVSYNKLLKFLVWRIKI